MQLLIKALLDSRKKKLELVKRMVGLGADIHSADRSGNLLGSILNKLKIIIVFSSF